MRLDAEALLQLEAERADRKRKRLAADERLNLAIRTGEMRPAKEFPCADCGHEWSSADKIRHDWHHHRGYEIEHQLDVVAVCRPCHQKRHGKHGKIKAFTPDEKRAYFAESRRRNRAENKVLTAAGAPLPTQANIDDALADAGIMILAIGAPGAEYIRSVLEKYFAHIPGIAMKIEANAKSGKLKPKLIARKP